MPSSLSRSVVNPWIRLTLDEKVRTATGSSAAIELTNAAAASFAFSMGSPAMLVLTSMTSMALMGTASGSLKLTTLLTLAWGASSPVTRKSSAVRFGSG